MIDFLTHIALFYLGVCYLIVLYSLFRYHSIAREELIAAGHTKINTIIIVSVLFAPVVLPVGYFIVQKKDREYLEKLEARTDLIGLLTLYVDQLKAAGVFSYDGVVYLYDDKEKNYSIVSLESLDNSFLSELRKYTDNEVEYIPFSLNDIAYLYISNQLDIMKTKTPEERKFIIETIESEVLEFDNEKIEKTILH